MSSSDSPGHLDRHDWVLHAFPRQGETVTAIQLSRRTGLSYHDVWVVLTGLHLAGRVLRRRGTLRPGMRGTPPVEWSRAHP